MTRTARLKSASVALVVLLAAGCSSVDRLLVTRQAYSEFGALYPQQFTNVQVTIEFATASESGDALFIVSNQSGMPVTFPGDYGVKILGYSGASKSWVELTNSVQYPTGSAILMPKGPGIADVGQLYIFPRAPYPDDLLFARVIVAGTITTDAQRHQPVFAFAPLPLSLVKDQ
jgi:hypothetical protein